MTINQITPLKAVRNSAKVARDAYSEAIANPAAADWTAIAAMLFAALPAEKRAKGLSDDSWADYDAKKSKLIWPAPSIAVQFADGEIVRMSFPSEVGRPWNLGCALRVVCFVYRARVRRLMTSGFSENTIFSDRLSLEAQQAFVTVPEISSCHIEQAGAVQHTVDPAVANDRTAELRRGTFRLPSLIGPTLPGVKEAELMAYKIAAARMALETLGDELDASEMFEAFRSIEWADWRYGPDYEPELIRFLDWRRSSDVLAMDLHRARRMADAVAVLEPLCHETDNADNIAEPATGMVDLAEAAVAKAKLAEVTAPPAPAPVPARDPDVVYLIWQTEKRARKATGATRVVLQHEGREIGCAFKSSNIYKAIATCDRKMVVVEGETMDAARGALELNLTARAAELFGFPTVAFMGVSQ